jgi:hypothetical protein
MKSGYKYNEIVDSDGTATFPAGDPIQLFVDYGSLSTVSAAGRSYYLNMVIDALSEIESYLETFEAQKKI